MVPSLRRAVAPIVLTLRVGLLVLASIAAAAPARADDEICGVVVFYRQAGDATVYRGVRYGEIDVVSHEPPAVFVQRVLVDPNDLITLNPNQEFACAP
jgi:hypothetical protein